VEIPTSLYCFFKKQTNRSHPAISHSQAAQKIGDGDKERRKEKTNPLTTFYRGFSFHMQGISDFQCLLYIESCELFLKVQDVWWICCTEKNVCVFVLVCRESFKKEETGRPPHALTPPHPSDCKTWKLVAYGLQNDEKY
jgi:hypothetical protein